MSVSLVQVAHALSELVVRLTDGVPEDEDVKAGWTAFALFLLLAGAVAVLGLSLVKQLRKAEAAKEAGVYGDEPTTQEPGSTGDGGVPPTHGREDVPQG